MDANEAQVAMKVLLKQEELLCYEGEFGAAEALALGEAAIEAAKAFGHS